MEENALQAPSLKPPFVTFIIVNFSRFVCFVRYETGELFVCFAYAGECFYANYSCRCATRAIWKTLKIHTREN